MAGTRFLAPAAAIAIGALCGPAISLADPGPGAVPPAAGRLLGTVVVTGDRVQRELADVDGTRLLAGKRTSVAQLTDLPPIEGPNFRQAFAEIPGLLVSEVSTGAWQSVSWRGLGEPHESWNVLTLQDGLPVGPDAWSYPAAYYVPPLDAVERVEFVRGGAGLIYGPLPGGTINYVTRVPARDEGFGGSAKLTTGSDGLRSALVGADARVGAWRVWGWGRYAEGDGPRRANSDHDQRTALARVAYEAASWRATLAYDFYDAEFGEPGGLTWARFDADRRAVSTPVDRFYVERRVPSLTVEGDTGAWAWSARAWSSDYERRSRRQAGGAFGVPTPPANVSIVQTQLFDGHGVDARVRRDLVVGERRHAVTAGITTWDVDAPVLVDKGATPTDDVGAFALARAARDGSTRAAFAEARLDFGRLAVVPGLRFERVDQSVVETLDLGTGSVTGGPPGAPNGPLGNRGDREDVTLWGLGLTYDATEHVRLLANASRGFKPKLFNDGVTFQAGVDAAGSFDATYSYTYEAGVQARPRPWLRLEASAFDVRLQNQVGLLGGPLAASPPFGAVGVGGARRVTVGTMNNRGVDLAGAVELFGPDGGPWGERGSRLRLALNAQLLDAEFVTGPAQGSRPQYAPRVLARGSVSHESEGGVRLALFATWTTRQNGVDNGAAEFEIPPAAILDASFEWPLTARVSLHGGVNNLLDRRYVGRVRPGGGQGIDPGAPRNWYAGASVGF